MQTFGERLRAAVAARGALCVGIDPHASLLRAWGLPDDPHGLAEFTRTVVSALADRVAVLKPQMAFFERFGSRGIAVLEEAVARARAAGALVLLDGKRGDVPSTVAGYADAYLSPSSPLRVDAVTAHPYLGVPSLVPLFDAARTHGGGVFVVCRTSNPEAAAVQQARTAEGPSVAQHVADEVARLNRESTPAEPGPGGAGGALGSFGVVVGATVEPGLDLSRLGGPVLAPGLGAQGATAADLRRVFGDQLDAVLPSYSREVLRAGPDPAALRAAADRALAACEAVRGSTATAR
ncbi:MAG TPA: orotidine-5'-phosphate decarboxylase [Natronosporangium sp.]|nr:orotidine-5'-phosphate decarboxylase [Natronosporangium sp.]